MFAWCISSIKQRRGLDQRPTLTLYCLVKERLTLPRHSNCAKIQELQTRIPEERIRMVVSICMVHLHGWLHQTLLISLNGIRLWSAVLTFLMLTPVWTLCLQNPPSVHLHPCLNSVYKALHQSQWLLHHVPISPVHAAKIEEKTRQQSKIPLVFREVNVRDPHGGKDHSQKVGKWLHTCCMGSLIQPIHWEHSNTIWQENGKEGSCCIWRSFCSFESRALHSNLAMNAVSWAWVHLILDVCTDQCSHAP